MKLPALILSSLLGAALCAAAGYHFGHPAASPSGEPAEHRVLYWHDPMVPGPRFDKPGKSPFMDMQLEPVYADSAALDEGGVRITATMQQNLGLRLAIAREAAVTPSFDAVGTVQFDERDSVAVQTRVAGYIEQLQVRAPLQRVSRGQAMATIYAPEWLGPISEWLALKRSNAAPDLIAAARSRMQALSIPDELIAASEAAGTAQARFTLHAPASGVIAELGVREGAAVAPGSTLFRIAGLSTVWVVADVPEAQALRLARGQQVKARLQADPAFTFNGKLDEILPGINTTTRTQQARFALPNPGGRLTPGMLLSLEVRGEAARTRLVVPGEAVIRTGRRAVVLVQLPGGNFEPREVQIGAESGEDIEITQGLKAGEQVVASGQFLIDSEARLRSALPAMTAASGASR